jgi:hypothetical protein
MDPARLRGYGLAALFPTHARVTLSALIYEQNFLRQTR